MTENTSVENLFLHGIHKNRFDTEFRMDGSFVFNYDKVYRQALRSRRHTIWKTRKKQGIKVGSDSSSIVLNEQEKADTSNHRIRHMFTNYDELWNKYWGKTSDAGLIHGDYRIAVVTKIVEMVPQLMIGYELVVNQSIEEQERTYAYLATKVRV